MGRIRDLQIQMVHHPLTRAHMIMDANWLARLQLVRVNRDIVLPKPGRVIKGKGQRLTRFERSHDQPIVLKVDGLERPDESQPMDRPGIASRRATAPKQTRQRQGGE